MPWKALRRPKRSGVVDNAVTWTNWSRNLQIFRPTLLQPLVREHADSRSVTLTRDLFWGAEHALAFIRVQRPVDDAGWLDDVWAEGGAVLDLDRKHFLLYGGEDVLNDVPLRRVYLEWLGRVWNGWTVRWACEGIADLADYVGYPRDKVLTNAASAG